MRFFPVVCLALGFSGCVMMTPRQYDASLKAAQDRKECPAPPSPFTVPNYPWNPGDTIILPQNHYPYELKIGTMTPTWSPQNTGTIR